MGPQEFEGGCLCASVRFRAAGPATSLCYCHCRSCRLASGAPCVAWGTFPRDGFRILGGELREFASSAKVTRGFCAACGCAITYRHEARPAVLDVALATLDEPAALAPEFHIWVSHKLPWVRLGDGLPAFPEWKQS